MSAFVVEDSTINRVVTFLGDGRDLDWIRRVLKEQGFDLSTREGKEKLANEMFLLNVKGVDERYGEGQAKDFRQLDFKYQINPNYNNISAYKSLSCWLYQCSEGDIPQESALFKLMSNVKGWIAESIVARLPEYNKAPWN